MTKRNKVIYWIATAWLALGMASTGIVQIIQMEEEAKKMNTLGYPAYFFILIGTWKLLGVVAVLIPKFPLVKEWAYAGFFFLTTGALFTHMAVGDKSAEYFGASLLLVLTILSWYFRPNDRKLLIALK
jgi:uncharacterized membrane protein YphA (DoxX/SURF4 family)